MSIRIWDYLNPLDVEALAEQFRTARPTRYFVADDFLRDDFAREVRAAFPTYRDALQVGHQFRAVNEKLKIQVTDPARFPGPVRTLSDVLESPEFLDLMVRITGIEELQADDQHSGGGMHLMASGGRLDVHVDFNIIRDRQLYRRLNILVFQNEEWEEAWGGAFELWDADVETCVFRAEPLGNRCVVFNTTESSFHGVTPVRTPAGITRNSYAAYYYTPHPPAGEDWSFHSTMFRARPDEKWRERLLVPAEKSARALREGLGKLKRTLRRKPDED